MVLVEEKLWLKVLLFQVVLVNLPVEERQNILHLVVVQNQVVALVVESQNLAVHLLPLPHQKMIKKTLTGLLLPLIDWNVLFLVWI